MKHKQIIKLQMLAIQIIFEYFMKQFFSTSTYNLQHFLYVASSEASLDKEK